MLYNLITSIGISDEAYHLYFVDSYYTKGDIVQNEKEKIYITEEIPHTSPNDVYCYKCYKLNWIGRFLLFLVYVGSTFQHAYIIGKLWLENVLNATKRLK